MSSPEFPIVERNKNLVEFGVGQILLSVSSEVEP
jgi:hypothetical protein